MHLTTYEQQYIAALRTIYENGYEDGVNERTGISTKRLPGIVIRVDVEKEFPILKSKFVAAKTAQREIEWIWKQQSNRLSDLKANIWSEWGSETTSKQLVLIDHPELDMSKYEIKDTLVNPLPDDISQYDKHNSHSFGEFIVLSQNGKKRMIQFLNSGNIVEVSGLDRIKAGQIMDYYARSCYGLGFYGDYKANDILEYFGEYHHRWVEIWRHLIKRCAKADGLYKDTICSNNFTSCEYFLRWVMANNRYSEHKCLGTLQIDKDYYGYNFYSEDTCVLLTPEENCSLIKSKWYIYHGKSGDEVFYSKYQLARFLEHKMRTSYISYKDGKKNGVSNSFDSVIKKLQNNGVLEIIDPHVEKDGKLIRFDLKPDLTIGLAYGAQVRKNVNFRLPDGTLRTYDSQADFVINYLKEFPNGRQAVATLWSPEELYLMNLVPCCHTSTWNLDGGRLNCVLDQRSGDMPYGVPFNTTQYAELMCMIARELDVKPGILTHVIADAHIYANQMKGVELQLAYYDLMDMIYHKNRDNVPYYTNRILELNPNSDKTFDDYINMATAALNSVPHFEIYAPQTVGFFDYIADDCKVEDYVHMGKIDFGDVAV